MFAAMQPRVAGQRSARLRRGRGAHPPLPRTASPVCSLGSGGVGGSHPGEPRCPSGNAARDALSARETLCWLLTNVMCLCCFEEQQSSLVLVPE